MFIKQWISQNWKKVDRRKYVCLRIGLLVQCMHANLFVTYKQYNWSLHYIIGILVKSNCFPYLLFIGLFMNTYTITCAWSNIFVVKLTLSEIVYFKSLLNTCINIFFLLRSQIFPANPRLHHPLHCPVDMWHLLVRWQLQLHSALRPLPKCHIREFAICYQTIIHVKLYKCISNIWRIKYNLLRLKRKPISPEHANYVKYVTIQNKVIVLK